ncbi:glycosyltransferase family 9 protein [Agarivorans sp. 1_MG-2023]|uniref:glycosyltransferase family 9 protein n=1 Tax=Agarivorans sp. 1_MG-2023 TaxID=3062634 RepID=UPI0026E2C7E4|nr:glycosyltransferase family 9 protein [Agarivorans sp. 1_MG-2023]MDO6764328.1 glycosyltransferase family 9 protein [Agarivorans sp. 1_MG-2023]
MIIRAGALGDTVFATAIVDALHTQFKQALSVDWLGTSLAVGLFKEDPIISKVFVLNRRKLPIWLSKEKRSVVAHSRKQPYDLLINLEHSKRFSSLYNAISARKKLTVTEVKAGQVLGPHAVDNMLSVLAGTEFKYLAAKPRLIGAPATLLKKKFALPDSFVVLHAANSHSDKQDYRSYRSWPIDCWLSLAKSLLPSTHIVLVGTREEAGSLLPLTSIKHAKLHNLVGATNIAELIGVLGLARVVITTDTGPSHIAAAAGAPTLALFGPSDSNETGPYSCETNEVKIASLNLDCSPCSFTPRFKQCKHNNCMKLLSVDMVLSHLKDLMD